MMIPSLKKAKSECIHRKNLQPRLCDRLSFILLHNIALNADSRNEQISLSDVGKRTILSVPNCAERFLQRFLFQQQLQIPIIQSLGSLSTTK